jgi:mRNA-degrading endonuclease toxin of MazEF toxin-antitoxin module
MARGDILLVGLPESDKREEKGNRPAIAVQTDIAILVQKIWLKQQFPVKI